MVVCSVVKPFEIRSTACIAGHLRNCLTGLTHSMKMLFCMLILVWCTVWCVRNKEHDDNYWMGLHVCVCAVHTPSNWSFNGFAQSSKCPHSHSHEKWKWKWNCLNDGCVCSYLYGVRHQNNTCVPWLNIIIKCNYGRGAHFHKVQHLSLHW